MGLGVLLTMYLFVNNSAGDVPEIIVHYSKGSHRLI